MKNTKHEPSWLDLIIAGLVGAVIALMILLFLGGI